jgi:hypothetical protein
MIRRYQMKKTILIVALTVLALAALGVGVAFAQDENPPFDGRGPGDGSGLLHDYMEKAMADALGLPVSEFESRHDAGETFYQIALAEGFSAEEIPALMQDARAKALDAAAKDGIITQEQADWMSSRGFGRGGMMNGSGRGNADGACPMHDGDEVPYGQYGPGNGMMGGSRWQQDNQ